ncbi:hypothetical protein [Hydrogenophaga sp.]|uniref:hypothetical protein n=1 Tax=Hydrogenophaga sp. TaxID=1904254 RepID=UPI0026226576|nr:hypothetical protein [Hydrogenophaga sp.]MCW5654280.1 hypothetical protein [Hydrogenophaga sp.]
MAKPAPHITAEYDREHFSIHPAIIARSIVARQQAGELANLLRASTGLVDMVLRPSASDTPEVARLRQTLREATQIQAHQMDTQVNALLNTTQLLQELVAEVAGIEPGTVLV